MSNNPIPEGEDYVAIIEELTKGELTPASLVQRLNTMFSSLASRTNFLKGLIEALPDPGDGGGAGLPAYLAALDLRLTLNALDEEAVPETLVGCTSEVDGSFYALTPDDPLPQAGFGNDMMDCYSAESKPIVPNIVLVGDVAFTIPKALFKGDLHILLFGLFDTSIPVIDLDTAFTPTNTANAAFAVQIANQNAAAGVGFVGGSPVSFSLPTYNLLTSSPNAALDQNDPSLTGTLLNEGQTGTTAVTTNLTDGVIPNEFEHSFTVIAEPTITYFGFMTASVGAGTISGIFYDLSQAYQYATKLLAIGTDGSVVLIDTDVSNDPVYTTLVDDWASVAPSIGDVVTFTMTENAGNYSIGYQINGGSAVEVLSVPVAIPIKPFIYCNYAVPATEALVFDFGLDQEADMVATISTDSDTGAMTIAFDIDLLGTYTQSIGTFPTEEQIGTKFMRAAAAVYSLDHAAGIKVNFSGYQAAEIIYPELSDEAKDGDIQPISYGGELLGVTFNAGDLGILADSKSKIIKLFKDPYTRNVLTEDLYLSDGTTHYICSVPVKAGEVYEVKAGIVWTSSNASNGLNYAVISDLGTGTSLGVFARNGYAPHAQGAGTDNMQTLAFDPSHVTLSVPSSPLATNPYYARIDGLLACTTDGNLVISVVREQSGQTDYIKEGTFLELRKIN